MSVQDKRTIVGRVDTCGRDKTIKVIVEYARRHPLYGKVVQRRTTCHVHDEANIAKTGDIVEITACRPHSKTKTWELVQVVKSA